MAKKKKTKIASHTPEKRKYSLEQSPYYVPVFFAIMLLALVILFADFLFSDKMLYGSDMLTAGVYHRSMLVDYFNANGKVPQWDPYMFGGMPYVDAFHGDIFYPFSVLKFFFSLYFHLGFNLILHIFFGGVFMYLAARQFKLGKTASLLSAASYMFAGYFVSMVAPGHEGKIYVTALFPLVILFLDRAFEKNHFFNFSVVGLIVGIIIVSPHPQMSYFTLWVVGFYTLFRLIILWREKGKILPVIKPSLLAAYAVAIALLLSAIQFYPGYVYTSEFSPRADTKRGWDWATSWSLHEEEAFSLLIPEFAGTSSRTAKTYYWGKNVFKDNSESVGVVALFLALIGFFFVRRKEAYFFGGLALFAFIYALGATTPLFKIFFYLIPKVKSLRAPSMIMFIFSFSIALLAGMGVQAIIDWKKTNNAARRKKLNYLLLGFPALMFLTAFLFNFAGRKMLSLWTSTFYSDAATTFVQQGVSKLDVAYLNLPAIQSGAWFAFLFTALAALFAWMYLSGKSGIAVMAALAVLPVINGARFNSRFVDVVDPKNYFGSNPITEFLTRQPGNFRVSDIPGLMSSSLLPQFGIEIVKGYHGNQLRWYDDLLGGTSWKNLSNPRFLNLVGARYLLLPNDVETPPGYFGDEPVKIALTVGNIKIVQNDNAFNRAYLVSRYRLFSDRQEIYPEVLGSVDDLRQIVYLETEPEIDIPDDSIVSDSVWIISHAMDSVVLGVHCTANRLLVLTENYYDSWHVFVDGQPVELMRAYGTFRAVAVPAGAQQVLFKYESDRYATGKLVTWATSLYLLLAFGFCFWRDRFRKKVHSPENL